MRDAYEMVTLDTSPPRTIPYEEFQKMVDEAETTEEKLRLLLVDSYPGRRPDGQAVVDWMTPVSKRRITRSVDMRI